VERVVECPGLAAIITAVGPNPAKSHGRPVARLIAPAATMRTAETSGTHTASAAAAGERPFQSAVMLVPVAESVDETTIVGAVGVGADISGWWVGRGPA
jgi:hypothetical protein